MKLTIFFDGSFWCGIIEYLDKNGQFRAYRHLFGKEPKNAELLAFVNGQLSAILTRDEQRVSGGIAVEKSRLQKKVNPKRTQRKINRLKKKPLVSTKAQLAMSKGYENVKKQSKKNSRLKKEKLKEEKFQKKQAKKRQKKKGH